MEVHLSESAALSRKNLGRDDLISYYACYGYTAQQIYASLQEVHGIEIRYFKSIIVAVDIM